MMKNNAFIDANVLVGVCTYTNSATKLITLIRNAGFKLYTFRKCIYEVYSVVKGTNKKSGTNPLKHLFPQEINDIAQKLFRTNKEINILANAYYWYNLSEEWRGRDSFEINRANIDHYVKESDKEKALEWLNIQREFVKWKEAMSKAFSQIDKLIADNGIFICEYFQVYSSEWYKSEGYFFEHEFARNSLLPNEDFELIMAAIFLQSKVFITTDEKRLAIRGRLSLGLNNNVPAFCTPKRLEDAIKDDFKLGYYV